MCVSGSTLGWPAPVSLNFSLFQDVRLGLLCFCILRDFLNQHPKQAKVCPVGVQGSSSIYPLIISSRNTSCHFVITVCKMTSSHHITPLVLCSQAAGLTVYLPLLTHSPAVSGSYIPHIPGTPPSLLPFCCAVFTADI